MCGGAAGFAVSQTVMARVNIATIQHPLDGGVPRSLARPGIPGRISVTTRQQPIEQTVHWLPQSGVAHSLNV